MKYLAMEDFCGVISDEIGGGNGLQPMILAAEANRPVLDADLMGRAYPNVRRKLLVRIRTCTYRSSFTIVDVPESSRCL